MSLRNIGSPRRQFGDPVAPEPKSVKFITPPKSDVTYLNLPLYAIAAAANDRVKETGKLVFHTVGDTGGINGTAAQEAVAQAMESQLTPANEADTPAFFYHLGDVVYYNGMPTHYDEQFYEPYKNYVAPIVAIAGNHDGQTAVRANDEADPFPTLTGFMENFCATHSMFAGHDRDTMTQPYVWWTLDTPVATIIGLYSNVDGSLDGRGSFEQQNWLHLQLQAASKDKALLITVHHPPYSLDSAHGGSPDICIAIDRAIKETNRIPDAIFSGHVHSYQRFTRKIQGLEVPYIVAGAGGYAATPKAIHKLQHGQKNGLKLPFQTLSKDVALANYQDVAPGFLRITIDDKTLKGEYFTVPFDGGFGEHELFESFTLDLKKHKVSKS